MIPTGPPDAPCVEKWLMFGISLRHRERNGFQTVLLPDQSVVSKAAVDATPGKDCTTLINLVSPALSRSLEPDHAQSGGLSAVLRKGEATIPLLCRLSLLSSSSIGKHVLVGNSEFSRNCYL
ncbi:MAG: hypothetical protein ACLR6J_05825 [Parabacteroides merdae]